MDTRVTSNESPLIVIVGETGTGKSDLAIKLAGLFDCEIVAGDSRTIYKGMNIGTAKPNSADQKRVPHHLLDISEIDQLITVAQYKQLADQVITDIIGRHKIPILVGGSGLYIDSVIFNYSFNSEYIEGQREMLNKQSVDDLKKIIVNEEIAMPINSNNKRHLVRQIETKGRLPQNTKLRPNTLVIGVSSDPESRNDNIKRRVDQMIKNGLEKEATSLGDKYGWKIEPMLSIGYREFAPFSSSGKTIDQISSEITKNTLSYSKRQRTWFKRNKNIHWISKQIEAVDLTTTFLNK